MLAPRASRERLHFRDDQKLIVAVEHCTCQRPRKATGLRGSEEKYLQNYKMLVQQVAQQVTPGQPDRMIALENASLDRWPPVDKSTLQRWQRSHLAHFDKWCAPAARKSLINGYQLSEARASIMPILIQPAEWTRPRIGSFEIVSRPTTPYRGTQPHMLALMVRGFCAARQVFSLVHGNKCIGSALLFSKLRTMKWPSIARLVKMLDEEVSAYE